jgi:hypothetical protein
MLKFLHYLSPKLLVTILTTMSLLSQEFLTLPPEGDADADDDVDSLSAFYKFTKRK